MSDVVLPKEIWDNDLTASPPVKTDWLWQGFIAPGNTTALLAHVDVSIEMRCPGGDPLTRRRRLVALSRHKETPRQLLLELNAQGTDYLTIDDVPADDFAINWDRVRAILEDAPQKLTRLDVLDEWPPDFDKPDRATLWRWLDRAAKLGVVACEGRGRKNDPFRYWLPEREAVWKQEPFYEVFEEQRRKLKLPFESLRERRRKLGHDPEFGGYDPASRIRISG